MWSNVVGQNRETDGEHDNDCVKEGFQLARVKFHRVGEGGKEALNVENCNINIWHGSELELAWSKKSSSYVEKNFPKFLLFDIMNTSPCK